MEGSSWAGPVRLFLEANKGAEGTRGLRGI